MICFALARVSVKNNMAHVALRAGGGGGGTTSAFINVFQLQVCSLQIRSSLLVSKRLDRDHTSAVPVGPDGWTGRMFRRRVTVAWAV